MGDWFRFPHNKYQPGVPEQLMQDVEVWSTLWSPKSATSHRTVLTLTVDVQLDMTRSKAKDFETYNKSIGQSLISSYVDKTTEELRRVAEAHAQQDELSSQGEIGIVDVSLEQPEPINQAGHTTYHVHITLKRGPGASKAKAATPSPSSRGGGNRRVRGLRDAVNHDQLLRKVSQDLEKLADEVAKEDDDDDDNDGGGGGGVGSPLHSPANRGRVTKRSGRNHLTHVAEQSPFPTVEDLCGLRLGNIRTCADGMQSIAALRFTAFATAARVMQVFDRDTIMRLRMVEGATTRAHTEPRTVVMRTRLARFCETDELGSAATAAATAAAVSSEEGGGGGGRRVGGLSGALRRRGSAKAAARYVHDVKAEKTTIFLAQVRGVHTHTVSTCNTSQRNGRVFAVVPGLDDVPAGRPPVDTACVDRSIDARLGGELELHFRMIDWFCCLLVVCLLARAWHTYSPFTAPTSPHSASCTSWSRNSTACLPCSTASISTPTATSQCSARYDDDGQTCLSVCLSMCGIVDWCGRSPGLVACVFPSFFRCRVCVNMIHTVRQIPR